AVLRGYAEEFGLAVTGSSDYHGVGKPNRLGEHTTPRAVLERIVDEATGTSPFFGECALAVQYPSAEGLAGWLGPATLECGESAKETAMTVIEPRDQVEREEMISELRRECEGQVLTPEEAGYAEACAAWNLV